MAIEHILMTGWRMDVCMCICVSVVQRPNGIGSAKKSPEEKERNEKPCRDGGIVIFFSSFQTDSKQIAFICDYDID